MLKRLKQYFGLSELFSKRVVAKYGEQCWTFLDPRLIDVLVWLREGLGIPLLINTPTMQQRGFRENTCEMVAGKTNSGIIYVSAHCLGKGFDCSSLNGKMSASQMRQWVRDHINECPWPIRMERTQNGKPTSWLHIDVCNLGDKNKLIEFNA